MGDLAGGIFDSVALGTSADGSVVVGRGDSAFGSEAFRWTQLQGLVGLGDLAGGTFYSQARGTSADGSVIVGFGTSVEGTEAFRWNASTGMVGLGAMPSPTFFSEARAISADGSIVVGTTGSGSDYEAFIWDQFHGMRYLADVLTTDLGIDLSGWTLRFATSVSADGLTIVGDGFNPLGQPEAWIARLPEPSSLSLLLIGALVTLRRNRAARESRAASMAC